MFEMFISANYYTISNSYKTGKVLSIHLDGFQFGFAWMRILTGFPLPVFAVSKASRVCSILKWCVINGLTFILPLDTRPIDTG